MSNTKPKTDAEAPANGFPDRNAQTGVRKNNDTIEIDLLAVFWLMLANWWKIVLVAVLGGGIAFACTFYLIEPSYTANSSIYIVSASKNAVIDISELQLGSNLSDDYLYLMTARPLMETVAEKVGRDQTWKSIKESLDVSNSVGERIITISTTTYNPQLSADIANVLAQEACEFLPDVTGVDTTPNVIETALVPTVKSSPSFVKNVLIGAFAGAMLVAGMLFIRYLLNDTFVVSDDLVSYFGVTPLAVIPEGDLEKKGGHRKKKKHYGAYYYSGYYGGRYGETQETRSRKKESGKNAASQQKKEKNS